MKNRRNGCPIKISPETYDKISFLSTRKSQTRTAFIKEIVDALFQLGSLYPSGMNIEYQVSLMDSSILVKFSGKSCLQIGICSEEELEKKRKELMDSAKKDVAQAKKKLELKGELNA